MRTYGAVVVGSLLFVLAVSGPVRASDEPSIDDPFESVNRAIFWFNDVSDRYFIEYVAMGYDFLLPDPLERGIANVFENGRFPVKFANNLLQWKVRNAWGECVRLMLNTTAGIGGLFDAGVAAGFASHPEDFGQTLGYWGVPPGPYLMLPFLGPSNVRDGFGLATDTATLFYAFFLPFEVNAGLTIGNFINFRSMAMEVIRTNRASAFDLYVFTRNAYMSNRASRIRDQIQSDAPAEADEDLYYFDEEDDPYRLDEEFEE
ncbi:VacJ family lipoprotein [Myxococcota bacterium]|nr:VacJ family lipoprotein [Myxococcota bacterium]